MLCFTACNRDDGVISDNNSGTDTSGGLMSRLDSDLMDMGSAVGSTVSDIMGGNDTDTMTTTDTMSR